MGGIVHVENRVPWEIASQAVVAESCNVLGEESKQVDDLPTLGRAIHFACLDLVADPGHPCDEPVLVVLGREPAFPFLKDRLDLVGIHDEATQPEESGNPTRPVHRRFIDQFRPGEKIVRHRWCSGRKLARESEVHTLEKVQWRVLSWRSHPRLFSAIPGHGLHSRSDPARIPTEIPVPLRLHGWESSRFIHLTV